LMPSAPSVRLNSRAGDNPLYHPVSAGSELTGAAVTRLSGTSAPVLPSARNGSAARLGRQ
jgi:hypothetical protein